MKSKKIIYFQDLLQKCSISSLTTGSSSKMNDKEQMGNDLSEIFFELANSKQIGYKYDSLLKSETKRDETETNFIIIEQDNECQIHTGGIVWETSYLLASFLESKFKESSLSLPLGKTLEIGAGCGMLGLVLAAKPLCSSMVLTETEGPMKILRQNVEFNKERCYPSSKQNKNKFNTNDDNHSFSINAKVHSLNWNNFEEDIRNSNNDLLPHSFDTIVGTDVVFSTDLVIPLLQTISKMSHEQTNIYLCLQERCKDAHELLLQKIPNYFTYQNITNQLQTHCYWGIQLDCQLYCLKPLPKKKRKRKSDTSKKNKKKKRNKKDKKK